MHRNITLPFVLLLSLGCPSTSDDHDHAHPDAGSLAPTHENQAVDAGGVHDMEDAGISDFELPRADLRVITLAGEYTDDDMTHVISTRRWFIYENDTENVSEFKILSYHNDERVAVAINSPNNAYHPGAYSRFDWVVETSGAVHYCQTRYDATTVQEAFEAAAADRDDLVGGCNDSPWNALRGTDLDFVGLYTDHWGTEHDVNNTGWVQTLSWSNDGGVVTDSSEFTRLYHSNRQGWMIAQNHIDNAWNAGLFSRFDWINAGGQQYFCQTTYDSATAKEAIEATAVDASDPANSGCGFSSWSSLTSNEE
jgi:hypothetical protein